MALMTDRERAERDLDDALGEVSRLEIVVMDREASIMRMEERTATHLEEIKQLRDRLELSHGAHDRTQDTNTRLTIQLSDTKFELARYKREVKGWIEKIKESNWRGYTSLVVLEEMMLLLKYGGK